MFSHSLSGLLYILLFILAIALILYLRFLFFKYGDKDSKYPIVQHSNKKLPPPPDPEPFLPGSRMGGEFNEDAEKAMKEGLELTEFKEERFKKKHHLLGTKEDIKRAFILDDILDKKFFKRDDWRD